MFKNLERLSVHHLSHALRDCGDAVVQIHLPRRNINGFILLMAEAAAPGNKPKKTHGNKHGQWPHVGHKSSKASGKWNDRGLEFA